MTPGDLAILLVLAAAALAGAGAGIARAVTLLVAEALIVASAALLSAPISGYLVRQWAERELGYAQMVSFLILLVGGTLAVVTIAWLRTRDRDLRIGPAVVDRLGGAAIAMMAAVILLAAMDLGLSLGYGSAAPGSRSVSREAPALVYRAAIASQLGGRIHREVVPMLRVVLEPALPSSVRSARNR